MSADKTLKASDRPLAEQLEDGLRCSLDTFGQIAALLYVAKEMAPEHSPLRKLLDLGWYVASDMENHVDCILEQLPADEVTQ